MNILRALGSALVAVLTGAGVSAAAQTIDQQRAGVVRVTAVLDGATKIGTGFIVRLDADTAYILTASHVPLCPSSFTPFALETRAKSDSDNARGAGPALERAISCFSGVP